MLTVELMCGCNTMDRVVLICGILCVFFSFSSTDKVPLLIWSNDRSLSLPHPLAGHTISAEDLTQQFLSKLTADGSKNVVLFIQDKLSLCDITQNAAVYGTDNEGEDALKAIKALMSSKSVAQLPSVDNPVAAFADLKSHFTAGSIHELQSPYRLSDLTLDPAGHNLIIVKLPATPVGESAYRKLLKSNDEVVGSVSDQLEKLPVQYVGVYTGAKSANEESVSWMNSDTKLSRSGRQLLQSQTTVAPSDERPLAFRNGSFLFYVGNLTVLANGTHTYSTDGRDWDVSGCDNSTESSCYVEMKSRQQPPLRLVFNLVKTLPSNNGFWYIGNVTVEFDKNEAALMRPFVELTPWGYSYHCYPPTNISSYNSDLHLVLYNFQIQAFSLRADGKFGYYNDCVGFFSIPIWMGVITSLVLIAILLFGVIMLMDVKTVDRFDDPKGKTITVTATD